MTMKIENYETHKAGISADTFTFQYNPQVFDDSIDKFIQQTDYAYNFSYFGTTKPFKSKRPLIINGHFSGASKSTYYQTLALHMNSNNIKKFYFSTGKFYIVIPQTVKKTHSSMRTNFIDYVGSLISPFGILFDNTQQSGLKAGAQDNQGNAWTPIEKITGSVVSGQTVTIEDNDGNGFTFVASATGTFTMYLIYNVDMGSDMYFTEYIYGVIGTTRQKLKKSNSGKSMLLGIAAGDDLNDTFGTATITNITATFYFRNGYTSD